MSNTHGDVLNTREAEMAAYDRLPAPIRLAIGEAPFPYSASALAWAFDSGKDRFPTQEAAVAAFLAHLRRDIAGKLQRYAL